MQCLYYDDAVLMADGNRKSIQHVRVGDKVVTFDPSTLVTSTTTVVHQYVRETDKRIFEITTKSGRSIRATHDHKFMTSEGWMAVDDFDVGTTLVAILPLHLMGGVVGSRVTECVEEEHRLFQQHRKFLRNNDDTWMPQVRAQGSMLFVPLESKREIANCMIADITVESANHSFIGGDGFAVSNSAMGKQAVGVYATNFRHRYDTMAHVLNYPQKPIVETRMAKMLSPLPCGQNAIVAIATHAGYNQEDSIIMNQSSIDRGLFTTTYYRTYREQAGKNHANGEEEFFTKPDLLTTKNLRPFKYDKLADDGFVPENTAVSGGDVIIGRCMPQKANAAIVHRDTSVALKSNEHGYIDRNAVHNRHFVNTNGDGYTFAKVRIRSDRIPKIGDKMSSVSGQKGTIGMTYRQEEMPFCPDTGMVPDIILNPHAIPSRMTIGQLMEMLLGRACCAQGVYGDGTPFMDLSISDITKVLEEKCNLQRFGLSIMHDPRTGKQMDMLIFNGPCLYQRLKHMVQVCTACPVCHAPPCPPVANSTRSPPSPPFPPLPFMCPTGQDPQPQPARTRGPPHAPARRGTRAGWGASPWRDGSRMFRESRHRVVPQGTHDGVQRRLQDLHLPSVRTHGHGQPRALAL